MGHTGAMINLGDRLLTSSTPHLEHVRRWYQQVGNARTPMRASYEAL